MKNKRLFSGMLLYALLLQTALAQTNFSILVEPYVIPGLPGLQSFAAAQYNGRWILIGGRTEGLHQRQPFSSFLDTYNNTNIYVVDPVTKNVWSASVNSLSTALKEQLQSTNMNFCNKGDKFYIAGGYGYSATINNHKTYASLVVIDMPGLINAVINNSSILPYFRQLNDNMFAITGGQMAKLGDMFLLVGGQKFDGRYNPNNGPSFTQVYSNQIRQFRLNDDGVQLSIAYQNAISDVNQLHRRDYNLAPQVFPDGRLGYTAFSGVFQTAANLPFLNTVDIDTSGYYPNNNFNQLLNHYHSGKLEIYDAAANAMHSIFFGGMAQYYYDAGGVLVQDNEVPFVSTIGKVTRVANGSMSETKMGDLPGLIGSGAELLLNPALPLYENDVIKLNNISQDTILAGYLVGGIQSTAPNIFFINTGTQSVAANTVYQIKLVHTSTLPVQLIYFRALKQQDAVLLEWKTSSELHNRAFEIERSANGLQFVSIGTRPGSNNSSTEKTYSFKDLSPAYGLNYYRLKILGTDGSFTYSNIILTRFQNENQQLLLYPNPVKDKLMVELQQNITGKIFLRILDINNRVIIAQFIKLNGRLLYINTATLPKGVYILQVEENNIMQQNRFIKE